MKKIFCTISIVILLISQSCMRDPIESTKKDIEIESPDPEPTPDPDSVIDFTKDVFIDMPYGTNEHQVMDIFLQKERTENTPLILLIHGGGWGSGDKKDADFLREAAYANGLNVVNINYRLASNEPKKEIHYNDMIQDIDAVIAMLVEHSFDFRIRNSKICMWGGSAGGHLALLYAYKHDTWNAISFVSSLGGPTALDNIESFNEVENKEATANMLSLLVGKPFYWDQPLDAAYQDASPYHTAKVIPTLLVHGEYDYIVPKKQAELMKEVLDKHPEVISDYIMIRKGGHDGGGGDETSEADRQKAQQRLFEAIMHFSN